MKILTLVLILGLTGFAQAKSTVFTTNPDGTTTESITRDDVELQREIDKLSSSISSLETEEARILESLDKVRDDLSQRREERTAMEAVKSSMSIPVEP